MACGTNTEKSCGGCSCCKPRCRLSRYAVLFLLFVLGVPSFAFLFQYGTDMYAAVRFSEYSDEDLCSANTRLDASSWDQPQRILAPVGVSAVNELQRRGLDTLKCLDIMPAFFEKISEPTIQKEDSDTINNPVGSPKNP